MRSCRSVLWFASAPCSVNSGRFLYPDSQTGHQHVTRGHVHEFAYLNAKLAGNQAECRVQWGFHLPSYFICHLTSFAILQGCQDTYDALSCRGFPAH
jgi:hypothetical protein